MSDEKDTKPKATLIKHNKAEDDAAKHPKHTEKKKVVIVKKKVVVKKPKVVSKKTESSENKEEPKGKIKDKAPRVTKIEDPQIPKISPGPRRPAPRADGSVRRGYPGPSGDRYRSGGSNQGQTPNRGTGRPFDNRNKPGGYQGRSNNDSSQDNRGSGGRYPSRGGQNRPDGNRPGGNRPGGARPGGGRPMGNRPGGPRPGGGRPGGGRPPGNRPGVGGGGRPAPSAPTAFSDKKKSSGKKFFKSKKGSNKNYSKKKEQNTEKLYQYKKKTIAAANPVPKSIDIMEVITVSDLAKKMNLKASDLISKLMGMGMMVTINQQIDADTATILADEYKCKVNLVSLYDETIIESEEDKDEDMKPRPPIVTVMGHVDHGKTKLLDAIRNTNVVAGESGGITQHIGAYTVNTEKGELTFLDTPGHEAFTLMRSRGAQITDLVILVVSATEGAMPQTIEAVNHAKEAGVPIIVAINKMDLPDANPDRITQQLSEYNLMPEAWGGSTQFVKISALKGEGIDQLLDIVQLESEMLELTANWNCKAEGKVIESKVEQGRGNVSTVLVERGILKIGDSFVAGIYHGKVRAMFNDKGEKVDQATPSMPVEILGFSGTPSSGDPFQVTNNERTARQFGMKRQELKKHEEAKNVKKITLDNLYDSIQDGEVQELKVIIKGDVHGSVEALQAALEKLSTSEIRLTCIHSAAGAIVESDVTLAAASSAIIVGFHVRPTPKAMAVADKEKVEIRKYNVIYDAVEDIKLAMEGMLSPDYEEKVTGHVEIREVIRVPKIGLIAGCMVTDGKILRKSKVNILRDNVVIHTGDISSLKRFKDDVKEVAAGYECGVSIENFDSIQVGDILEAYELIEIAKKLGD